MANDAFTKDACMVTDCKFTTFICTHADEYDASTFSQLKVLNIPVFHVSSVSTAMRLRPQGRTKGRRHSIDYRTTCQPVLNS
eukprot:scaffold459551_cov17-Prasinocladus_malaysianus.AAC.1